MGPTVSYIVPTHNRKDDVTEAVESVLAQDYPRKEVIVVSDSSDGTRDLFEQGGNLAHESVRFRHSDTSLNPSSARNVGIEMASGDIYVFIDDDAVFVDDDATDHIVRKFENDPDAGILAFCIRDYHTGDLNGAEFPHPDREPSCERGFLTTYFVGAGCAVRPSALEQAGGFPDDFDRFEEIDLSFRVLDAGYTVEFFPDVTVEHKGTPEGQGPDRTVIRQDLENRTMTAVRNLPWRYVAVSTLVWIGYTFYRGGFDPVPVAVALRNVASQWRRLSAQRDVVSKQTLAYLKTHGGRLYY